MKFIQMLLIVSLMWLLLFDFAINPGLIPTVLVAPADDRFVHVMITAPENTSEYRFISPILPPPRQNGCCPMGGCRSASPSSGVRR